MTLRAAGAVLAATALLAPVSAQAPELAMLDRLERGTWELRLRGDSSSRRICVRSGRELIQLRHRQPGCDRFVVQDEPSEVTVQYTCRGNGYGRTTIRREGRDIVQLRSQGIHGGAPFSIEGEARHVGSC
nr:hypothetical protein [Aurantiacibacter sp. 219JJ12-13]MDP5260323.1 hypothetical protein [Aurantiacibacter sp. 219JJ12-13]